MSEPLKFLSQFEVDSLACEEAIESNMSRYQGGDFLDLAKQNGWQIESQIARWDPSIVDKLDPLDTPEAEVQNSLLIWKGMPGMTPALARDERLWTRLTHIECLEYSRARWLKGDKTDARQVRIHFFAKTLGGCRDDNAIGRLWWNAHVANLISGEDIEQGLSKLLARANNRMQIIERPNNGFRVPLAKGVMRMLGVDEWLNSKDSAIASFMKQVNKLSGSMIFEAMNESEIDSHLQICLARAKKQSS